MALSGRDRPHVKPWLFWMFSRFNRWYLNRHFHSVRLLKEAEPPETLSGPLLFYLNHSSWLDPLICLTHINRYFSNRTHFSVMDEEQLKKYPFFKGLGMFAIHSQSPSRGVKFVRTVQSLLSEKHHAFWITPQGRFADAGERPLNFQKGIGYLASRQKSGTFVPVAITYSFWDHKLPEVLTGFGEPIRVRDHKSRDMEEWTSLLEAGLEKILDPLLEADLRRDKDRFRSLHTETPDQKETNTSSPTESMN